MAMAVVGGHGPMMMLQGDLLSTYCCADIALSSGGDGVVSGRAAAGRTTMIATIGRRSSRFGCSAAEAEPASSSYSTSCRMQRMTITRSSRGSGRKEALRSRQQSDVGVGGAEADAMTGEEEEAMGSFWDRLQLAWRVLVGAPNEAQATKKRFSRLLVRDRGFNSANLSRLYLAAKGAIKEHVELEGDEDTEVTAVVDRLGELRLDFRVKRIKSVLRDEPFSDSVLPEMEPSLSISGDQLWEDSTSSHESEVHVGVALDECLLNSGPPDDEPSLSISGDQLSEYRRTPLDLKARLGLALDRPIPKFVVSDGEPLVSTSGGLLWEDNNSSQGIEVVVGPLDEPFHMSVLDEEPYLSLSGDPLWKDKMSQDLEDQVGHSNVKASAVTGALSEPVPNSILPDLKPIMLSVNRDQLLEEGRAMLDLLLAVEVDSDGEWCTFSFTDSRGGQKVGTTNVDSDLDEEQ